MVSRSVFRAHGEQRRDPLHRCRTRTPPAEGKEMPCQSPFRVSPSQGIRSRIAPDLPIPDVFPKTGHCAPVPLRNRLIMIAIAIFSARVTGFRTPAARYMLRS